MIELNGEPSMNQTGDKSGQHYDDTKRAMARHHVRLLMPREHAAPAPPHDRGRVAALQLQIARSSVQTFQHEACHPAARLHPVAGAAPAVPSLEERDELEHACAARDACEGGEKRDAIAGR